MCGLAGWYCRPGLEPPAEVLRKMSAAIRHRGPDHEGFHFEPEYGVALAHRRLSIIDLSERSNQPMLDADRQLALVYNGELYNFRQLRAALEARGHTLHTAGDTEVVLRSYAEWGAGCFERFAGMFAVALWDGRSRTLHLARDPMGIKPLYYQAQPGGVRFASEVKAFLELPGFRAELDPRGLSQYLEFGYVFDERATSMRGIAKVAPGHRLELRDGALVADVAYFVPGQPDPNDRRGQEARTAELAGTLDQVLAEHLVSDVPVGLLLSGGLDSSLLAALAARKGPLLSVSMGFAGSDVDERAHARLAAAHVGSTQVEVEIDAAEVEREFVSGAWVFDDLFADMGTITTRLLYRRCRKMGIKVVLVGEGADELFGGYDVFAAADRLGLWQKFRLYQRYAGRRYGRLFGAFDDAMTGYLRQGDGSPFDAIRLFESRRQLPNQYVMKVDKASMAESVEARTPYLDRRIADIAYRTPREWLLRGGENKFLLRAVARGAGLLPEAIGGRRKFGGSIASNWMDDSPRFRAFARERLLDAGSQTRRIGLDGPMRAYFDEGRQGYRFPAPISIFRNLAWRLLVLELWAGHYLDAARAGA